MGANGMQTITLCSTTTKPPLQRSQLNIFNHKVIIALQKRQQLEQNVPRVRVNILEPECVMGVFRSSNCWQFSKQDKIITGRET